MSLESETTLLGTPNTASPPAQPFMYFIPETASRKVLSHWSHWMETGISLQMTTQELLNSSPAWKIGQNMLQLMLSRFQRLKSRRMCFDVSGLFRCTLPSRCLKVRGVLNRHISDITGNEITIKANAAVDKLDEGLMECITMQNDATGFPPLHFCICYYNADSDCKSSCRESSGCSSSRL